jgi:NADPH-dependent 2,4-dienoyl-CoA reductase/sulfur reductase-like enzyme
VGGGFVGPVVVFCNGSGFCSESLKVSDLVCQQSLNIFLIVVSHQVSNLGTRQRASVPGVYAVGECALTFNGVDGSVTKIDLATTAFRQAVIGGTNAAGGDVVFPGALGTFVSFVGELEVASTGFNSEAAKSRGINVVAGKAKLGSTPKWMPDSKEVTVKIIAEAESGKIIGG